MESGRLAIKGLTIPVLIGAMLLFVACMGHPMMRRGGPIITTSGADAATIFTQSCSACHGVNREGGIGPSLRASDLEGRTDDYLMNTIRWGRGGMPPFGNRLNPEGVENLVDFLRSPGNLESTD
jgi:cytochrome c553